MMIDARQSTRQASEVELKLEFPPSDAARIASHPALASRVAAPVERALVSTYFDTPDGALHEQGVYLRIRDSGGGYVQTVKAAKASTDIFERSEWEQPVSGRTPDLEAVRGTALETLLTPEVRAALQARFETRIGRGLHRVETNGSEVEVAIDRGEINSRDRTSPICELELELKRGDKRDLFRLARQIAHDVPLRLEVKTKAERGYELLRDGAFAPEKAMPIDIAPELTAGKAFRLIALSCLRQIVANEPATCAGYAEALHQMRIGLRRLRATIALFADVVGGGDAEKIKDELKWITRQLGAARDLDVFASEVLTPLRDKRPDQATVAGALRDVERKRADAYANVRGAIDSPRFRAAMLDLAEWIEIGSWIEAEDNEHQAARDRSVFEHAKEKLARLRKKIRREGTHLGNLSVPQLHRLRIRAKRQRYATEFFAGTFPGEQQAKRRTESLDALKDLQDALGALNDIATHRDLIGDGAPLAPLAHPKDRTEDLLRDAEQAFGRFANTKAFWKV
jgi:inorganic triphosphatase YgiF